MIPPEDIARRNEQRRAPRRPRVEPAVEATHFPKIAAAFRHLQAKGRWIPNMRPVQAYKRIYDQLIADGHGDDMPKRDTVLRALKRLASEGAAERARKMRRMRGDNPR
jgi:hypothetical protein